MKASRIVLALALAGLAAPALAEKCHKCDFTDEPIIVTPTKQQGVGLTPLDAPARGGAQGAGNQQTRAFNFGKAGPATPAAGIARPTESLSLNFTKVEKGTPDVTTAAPHGPATPAAGIARPTESLLNFSKIEKGSPVVPTATPSGPAIRR